MAVIKGNLKTKGSARAYVYSEDPDVTAPAGRFGWVPADECEVRKGADVVTVQSLSDDTHATARDRLAHGQGIGRLYINRLAVSDWSGTKTAEERLAKVGDLMREDVDAFDLLAELVLARDNGRDIAAYYEHARQWLGKPAPEVPADGASKSVVG
jgi:GNAT superfamily N-acetyltransferase